MMPTSLIYNSTDENPLTVNIIDVTGRTVNSFAFNKVKSGKNSSTINSSGLSAGAFFLRTTSSEKENIFKIHKAVIIRRHFISRKLHLKKIHDNMHTQVFYFYIYLLNISI